MPTKEELLKYAKAIKENCENCNCEGCPFDDALECKISPILPEEWTV